MSEVTEVVLKKGVLSFDGRVVEIFGFGGGDGRRLHIAQVKRVELKSGRLSGETLEVASHNSSSLVSDLRPLDEHREGVEQFIEAVRAAAPNLEAP